MISQSSAAIPGQACRIVPLWGHGMPCPHRGTIRQACPGIAADDCEIIQIRRHQGDQRTARNARFPGLAAQLLRAGRSKRPGAQPNPPVHRGQSRPLGSGSWGLPQPGPRMQPKRPRQAGLTAPQENRSRTSNLNLTTYRYGLIEESRNRFFIAYHFWWGLIADPRIVAQAG